MWLSKSDSQVGGGHIVWELSNIPLGYALHVDLKIWHSTWHLFACFFLQIERLDMAQIVIIFPVCAEDIHSTTFWVPNGGPFL